MLYALFVISAFVSAVGTIAGFGGGVFIVPVMVIAFGIDAKIAIGVTALSLLPSSLLSTYWNMGKKAVDFRLMWMLEIPTMIGAVGGAALTSLVPQKPLELIFAAFLILLGRSVLVTSTRAGVFSRMIAALNGYPPAVRRPEYSVSLWAASLFGGLSGLLAGMFGIGGGVLKTPIMIKVFNVPVRTATATALCMIVFTSATSGFTHWSLGHVEYPLLAAGAGGFLFGAVLGHRFSRKMKDHTLKRVIAWSIMSAGIAVLLHVVWM